MSALVIAKAAVHVVSALGVTKVVGDIVKNNTVVMSTADKVLVNAGGIVLGSMVVDAASNHVSAALQTVTERFKKEETEDDTEK